MKIYLTSYFGWFFLLSSIIKLLVLETCAFIKNNYLFNTHINESPIILFKILLPSNSINNNNNYIKNLRAILLYATCIIFSLLADSFGPYPSSLLVPPSSIQNVPHSSPRVYARSSKQTTPLGPRGRSTSAPNVSFVNTGTTEEVCVCRAGSQSTAAVCQSTVVYL